MRGTIRTLMLGLMIGGSMRMLRWVREGLKKEVERVEDVVEDDVE